MVAHIAGVEDLAIIRNLETALEDEMKNFAACNAYAAWAEEESYHGLGSLFRATARAEHIHASNHARVLRHMGGSTLMEVRNPQVQGTMENLRSALLDQKFEVDYLYPTFLTNAASLFDSTAIRTFQWALEADKSHVQLYSDVISRLSDETFSNWLFEPHDFIVCALCGYAAERVEGANCPACNYLLEKFEKVA